MVAIVLALFTIELTTTLISVALKVAPHEAMLTIVYEAVTTEHLHIDRFFLHLEAWGGIIVILLKVLIENHSVSLREMTFDRTSGSDRA